MNRRSRIETTLEVAEKVESMVDTLISFLRKSDHMYCVYAHTTAATIQAFATNAKAVPYAMFICCEKLLGVVVSFNDW